MASNSDRSSAGSRRASTLISPVSSPPRRASSTRAASLRPLKTAWPSPSVLAWPSGLPASSSRLSSMPLRALPFFSEVANTSICSVCRRTCRPMSVT